MTTASGLLRRTTRESAPARTAGRRSRRRRLLGLAVVLAALLLVWEGVKWLAGDPWRIHAAIGSIQVDYEHVPPFEWRLATDLSLPHVWDILAAFVEPAQRAGSPLGVVLFGQALFTLAGAAVGFVVGASLGLALGVLFVHFRLAERAFVPYVVASQTVPILAIAPSSR
jgi:NitT/TauT family transport system permease protein